MAKTNKEDLRERIRRYKADPMAFFREVRIPRAGGAAPLGRVWAPFQRKMFEAITPCLRAVARGGNPPYRGFWLERTKGASKDSDVGLGLGWLAMFSPRPLDMELGAGDLSQARETSKAMRDVIRLNAWMKGRLTFHRSKIFCASTGSALEFLTTDATGAHGSRPDVSVCNELSHVASRDFMSTMLDNASKVPTNLTIIATNAGFLGTWQYRWRKSYQLNPRWWFQKVAEPAPWIDPADLAEAEARNTRARYLRLWWGVWSGEGDALDPADVEACVVLASPMVGPEPGWLFASGLDLGVKNDHAALVGLGAKLGTGRVALAACQSWAPGPNGQVDLVAVREAHLELHRRLNLAWCGYDPTQAVLMAQDLANAGLPMQEVSFVGRNLDTMARDLLATFRNRRIDLYRDPLLVDDLQRLTIAERRYGYKLEAISDERGHADRATALAIVLPAMLGVAHEVVAVERPERRAEWSVELADGVMG